MGQSQSQGDIRPPTTEELSKQLARKFARRCFTPLELYSFQDVFNSLADHEAGVSYLKEDSIARFLQVPDILDVSPVLFQMASYLGAFPFAQDAPAVLGLEEMIIVVVVMTERYTKVLKNSSKNRIRLFYRSLTVYDRFQGKEASGGDKDGVSEDMEVSKVNGNGHAGFSVDQPANDDEDDDDDDGLTLSALESLDAIDVFKHSDAPPISHCSIPSDNFRKIIMLLLLIAPLHAQESMPDFSDRLSGDSLEQLRVTAESILSSFVDTESDLGIKFRVWNTVIPASLPYLFNGFNELFSRFLFSKALDFTKHNPDHTPSSPPSSPLQPNTPPKPEPAPLPLLQEEGEILDLNILSQLSFFLPGDSLFRRLRLLYSGGDAGFSMRSFESRVFNWDAPSIILVSGTRIPTSDTNGPERAFADSLPPKRYPDSSTSNRLVFGAYISQPWRQTHKTCIGDSDTILFQLEPAHDVFRASATNTDYLSFTHAPLSHPGINIGSPHPQSKSTAGITSHVPIGAVSLYIDSAFEFGVFTHRTGGGGAFNGSASRRRDWQDRFEIQSLEVWGCGGAEQAEEQRRRWEWEEREAEARRKINLGTMDIDADRSLLEMAGIIGGHRSGGSMN